MSAEHIGEGLLAILRSEPDATPGFVRDLEHDAHVRVVAITTKRNTDRVRLELTVEPAPLAKQGAGVTALPQVDDVLTVKQPRSEWDVPRDDLGRHRP